MNKTYFKNILKDIKNTKGKVVSIAAMVGLAAAVVVALGLSGTTMRNTLGNNLNTYGHPDIIVRSTYGLDYEDEAILKRDKDIENISLVKTADLLEAETLIRLKSINKDIPKSVVVEGRMPEKKGELALNAGLAESYKIGDKINLSYVENSRIDDEVMENLSYEIVGFMKTSDFFMEDMREMSFTAKKELDGYGYVTEDNFDTDKYGEINIAYKNMDGFDFSSDDYKKFVRAKQEQIEDALSNRPGEVLASIKADINDELDTAEEEIADAKKELTDAEKELKDARAELDKGYKDYEEGKQTYEKEIADGKQKLADAQAEIASGEADLAAGRREYENNLAEFNRQIANGEAALNRNAQRIRTGRREIQNAQVEINAGRDKLENEFKSPRDELEKAKKELDKAKADIGAGESEYASKKAELDKLEAMLIQIPADIPNENSSPTLDDLEEDTNAGSDVSSFYGPTISDYPLGEREKPADPRDGQNSGSLSKKLAAKPSNPAEIEAMRAQLESGRSELAKARAELDAAKVKYQTGLFEYEQNKNTLDRRYQAELARLNEGQAELDIKRAELNNAESELERGRRELENNRQSGRAQLNEAAAEITRAQRELANARAELADGRTKLDEEAAKGKKEIEDAYNELLDGEEEYKEGLKEFEDQKSDALDEIAEGEEEIADGRDAIGRLVDPEYEVETVFDNEGINTYYQNSLNMDELSKVFPTFFYLVAMLVTLTTMKRFIEEQRTINGTLKALGYTNSQISQRFYLYGMIPTAIGALIGSVFGRFLIADVIINAYSSGFGNLGIDYVNSLPFVLFAILLSVFLIGLTVYFSSKETVKMSPASLLRPKAPNVGKKIWLEKINPLWKRLSFMQKITSRNLFRYKARMFMTLFGVGGCTALTFFGFAMIDSIKDTVRVEQDEISHYEVIAMVDENAKDDEIKDYKKSIGPYKTLDIRFKEAVIAKDGQRREVNIVIPDDASKIGEFVTLRTPKADPIDLAKEDAVLTQKAAKAMGISPGDTIKFIYDGKQIELPISNIVENYTGNYIYASKEAIEKITGTKPTMNASYLIGDADNVIKDIEDQKAVVALINASVIYASIDVLLENLNLVIGVITLISMMLALVVLYNLININVSERKRELATIKVLGFYPKEVTGYIFREIFILTLLGILIGFGLGYAMFRYIIAVVAPEDIMLYYHVSPRPYIMSALITIIISLILLVVVHRKLKDIDMAEAMSSGE